MIPEYSQKLNNAYNRCVRLCEDGHLEDALIFAEKAQRLGEQELGPDHPAAGILLNLVADIYRCLGRNEEAEPLFDRVISIFNKAYGPKHPYLTVPLMLAELNYIAMRRLMMSESVGLHAWAICEQCFGPRSQETLQTMNDLATIYRFMEGRDEAKFPHKRVLPICPKGPEPDPRDVGRNLYDLALLYGPSSFSVPLCWRAMAIFQDITEPNDPEFLGILETYATLVFKTEQHEKIEALLSRPELPRERILAITEKLQPADQRSIGLILLNLARLYDEQGCLAEAMPLCRRVMAIFVDIAGPDDADSVEALVSCAKLLIKAGKGEEAGEHLKRAHPLVRARVKLKLTDYRALWFGYLGFVAAIFIPLLLLSYCMESNTTNPSYRSTIQAPFTASKAGSLDTQQFVEAVLGPGGPGLEDIADQLQAQGRHDLAEDFYSQAIIAMGNPSHPMPSEPAATLENYADLLRRRGRPDEAEVLTGQDSLLFARGLKNLGDLYSVQARYTEAEPLYQRALQIVETEPDPLPSRYFAAKILTAYAELLRNTGRANEAAELEARANTVEGTGANQ